MLQQGQILNNRYQIESVIGEGGFGAVYKVWDDNLQRFCSIKENLQVSLEAQKQFKREAIMLANLNHPNLVRVTDYFIIQNQGQYLVMDYVDGDDLGTLLVQNGKPFSIEQALTWINQVCDALIYIHNQNPPVIHRDIKPANIRITPQGTVVLVDFGLAKVFDNSPQTTMGARGLTPHFAAPEQYGTGGTDAQSDIYSLGVTLYCLLTYRVPPDSVEIMVGNANPPPPAKNINKNIPDVVSEAIQRAMQIRRTERFKSVYDFQSSMLFQHKTPSQMRVVEQPTVQKINLTNNKLVLSNGMEFMYVPAGSFIMGSFSGNFEEEPRRSVHIPYDYWMARFPTTNLLYSHYVAAKDIKHPVSFWEEKKQHPVVYIKWADAIEYCDWLYNRFKAELPLGLILRLPTESEWEKSARGTDGREFPWGNRFDSNNCYITMKEVDSYLVEVDELKPVGTYSPQGDSPYGCSDMSGAVWQWTCSLYKDYHSVVKNIPRTISEKNYLAVRGGPGQDDPYGMRVSYRNYRDPSKSAMLQGFRVCLAPPNPK